MKGTAPRGRTLAEDRAHADNLQKSAKERAENIMILDMVRNDLGRLAPPGKVKTEAICTLEKYPTVWQMTSTATALSNASLAQTFQALFPCASITGAPKARTMQIIKQIEPQPRQIYTGTFGWIAPDRKAHFNVAIRTALVDRASQQTTYGVGAGITWDSNGEQEYRECLDKAAILTSQKNSFALIETLRWVPGKGYFILDEHLLRLQNSAEYFEFSFDRQKTNGYLEVIAKSFPLSPQRVRLLLYQDGTLEGSFQPLEETPHCPVTICFADTPVNHKDLLLFHKTTRRDLYNSNLENAGNVDEVILWNDKGEVTECCTANLVIIKDGKLVTPPLSSGLLPGTYRAYLLRKGILTEGVVYKKDLLNYPVYLINAVRKWRRAKVNTEP